MRFLGKWKVGSLRVVLSVGRVTTVQGVNSTLKDGNHMTMWEFDGTDPAPVYKALLEAQHRYHLPKITVARSHPGGGFHAYCWTRLTFAQSVHIVSGTEGVDPGFITMCAMRRHWTLRLTDKGTGVPSQDFDIASHQPDRSGFDDLRSGVFYDAYVSKAIVGPNWNRPEPL